jgi:uncharacterized repeat protein (TIGR03803 family)
MPLDHVLRPPPQRVQLRGGCFYPLAGSLSNELLQRGHPHQGNGGRQGWQPRRVQQARAKYAAGTSPPPPPRTQCCGHGWGHFLLNPGSSLRFSGRLICHFALAGIGSLAFATLMPLPTVAAPRITVQGSFDGTNGSGPYAALTAAGNGLYYGTTQYGGANGLGGIFALDSTTGLRICLLGRASNALDRWTPPAGARSANRSKE